MVKDEFLIYNHNRNKYQINWRAIKPWSLLPSEIELQFLIDAWPFVNGKFLDVGCGIKPYFLLFAPLVNRYIGVDLPPLRASNGKADVFADGQKMPFKSSSFDTVLCTEVLEHIPEPLEFLQELNRVLKIGGHLILTAPQLYWPHEKPLGFYRFTKYGLKYLAEKSGFNPIYIRPQGGLGLFLADSMSRGLRIAIGVLDNLKRTIFPKGQKSIADSFLTKYLLFLTQKVLLALYFNFMSKNGRKNHILRLKDRYTLRHLLVASKIRNL